MIPKSVMEEIEKVANEYEDDDHWSVASFKSGAIFGYELAQKQTPASDRDLDVRHWFIQKPTSNNCPLERSGAVFEQFMPTVSEKGCEWIKVYSADDIQKKIGMGLTRYAEICRELQSLKKQAPASGREWELKAVHPSGEVIRIREVTSKDAEREAVVMELAKALESSREYLLHKLRLGFGSTEDIKVVEDALAKWEAVK